MRRRHLHETWAQLLLSARDGRRIRAFLSEVYGITQDRLVGNMHLTVYYARRLLPGLRPTSQRAHVVLRAAETRFMVMAPGGENPKPELEPAHRTVGIRVQRKSSTMREILTYRAQLIAYEQRMGILGRRAPSDHRRNAFGARHFQPHMSLIKAGSGIDRDLTIIGRAFRENFDELTFDRFVIDVVSPARLETAHDEGRGKPTAAKFGNTMRWADRRG